jgi:negative regulator of sigma-B (phosphoserine phosphatase)
MSTSQVDWGVAAQALPGQAECGDMALVKDFDGGTLVAAVDGIGHGPEAATAAKLALASLEPDPQEPVISLVLRCHEALRGTRGVVMSLASYSLRHKLLTWIGIGNVAGILLRKTPTAGSSHESLLLRAGLIGSQLPPLQASVIPANAGDTLVFATDGVKSDFMTSVLLGAPPRRGAERILADHKKGTDDGLVVVVRF